MLTVGKYGTAHTSFDLQDDVRVDPFALNAGLTAADFLGTRQDATIDHGASLYFGDALSSFTTESTAG